MLSRKVWTLALAGAMGVAALPAFAEAITLEAAVQRTLQSNPALRAEGAAVEALQSQAGLDGLKPAMTLGAELENVAGSGDLSGIHSAETTLRLGQVIELGGKRQARQARAQANIDRQQNLQQQRQLELAAETTRRYIEVAKGQQELALAQRQLALAAETQSAVAQRVGRGVAPESDESLALIDAVRAEIELEHAEHELASAQFALAAMWGEAQAVAIQTTGDLLSLPTAPDFEILAARLQRTPENVAFLLDANRIEAERVLAQSAARPDLSLSLGVRRLEAIDDQALVFSFGMPLGSAERSAFAVARSEAEQLEVTARQHAAGLEARQKLFAAFQELRHARTEFEALSERMIPAAQKGLGLTRAGFEEARYSFLQLSQAQAILLQLQHERLDAAAKYHQLLAVIERSTAAAGASP